MVEAKVSYDVRNKVIRVQVLGAETIHDWEISKRRVIQLSSVHSCKRVIVDARRQLAAPETLELYQFARSWPVSIRVAKLVGANTRKEQHFVETVAINRGIPMRDFTDEGEAMTWLIE